MEGHFCWERPCVPGDDIQDALCEGLEAPGGYDVETFKEGWEYECGIRVVLVGYTTHAVMQEEAYPIYIAERGMRIQSWIVASLVILEKIQTS